VTAAHEGFPRRPDVLERGPAYLLHYLLDVLVDHYLPITERIAGAIDDLEEACFGEANGPLDQRILRLKRGMLALRRIVGPQRDTMLALTRDEFRAIPAEVRPFLRDVYDRLARVGDLLDSFRDEVTSLLEINVALISNRMNQVIKVLTVIATIMLPLTVVTGYYGMNFHLAEYEWKLGWLYALGLLVATAAGTWWFLKRRRWF
jgi:magnesium transporter